MWIQTNHHLNIIKGEQKKLQIFLKNNLVEFYSNLKILNIFEEAVVLAVEKSMTLRKSDQDIAKTK